MINQKQFQECYEEFKDQIVTSATVKPRFDELYSISKENDVLLVTICGSHKAGKSTFFNCIINDTQDISETNPNECTIRPNFVFADKKFAFRAYERKSDFNPYTDINNVLNYFISGNEKYIANDLSFREKTDKAKLAEYVNECQNPSKPFLFTSFALDSQSRFVKQLKNKNVVFVDMPGDDGIIAEKNSDPFYETVLKRTDLVLLVCSSAVDLGKSLEKYLNFIKDNNPKVPFVVVLNELDAKITLDARQERETQLANWESTLKNTYNLAVVKSAILNAHYIHIELFGEQFVDADIFKNKINKSFEDFKKFEDELYNDFFSQTKISDIVNDNKNSRFQAQMSKFTAFLDEEISKLSKECVDFNNKLNNFREIDSESIKNSIRNYFKDENGKSKNDYDLAECLDNNGQTRWFRPNIRRILKEKYFNGYLKESVERFVNMQIDTFRSNLSEKISKSEWSGKISLADIKSTFEQKDLEKSVYNDCIEGNLRYDRDKIEDSMLNLRSKLFSYENVGSEIRDKCKELVSDCINKIKDAEKISEKERTLEILKELKTKLV